MNNDLITKISELLERHNVFSLIIKKMEETSDWHIVVVNLADTLIKAHEFAQLQDELLTLDEIEYIDMVASARNLYIQVW